MRITGGDLARRTIPAQFAKHVRPTTDRVRESLLNHIEHNHGENLENVLDLYAGSGIVSLEFISRGAQKVSSVDMDFKNINAMKTIQKDWDLDQWVIVKQKVGSFLRQTSDTYDLIFADPPYNAPNLNTLPQDCLPKLNTGGILIVEHQPNLRFNLKPKTLKEYGSTVCSIFVKTP